MKSTGDEFGGLYKEHAMTDDVVSFISITLCSKLLVVICKSFLGLTFILFETRKPTPPPVLLVLSIHQGLNSVPS